MDGTLRQVVVTSIGHWRGEGLALVEAVAEGEHHGEGQRRTADRRRDGLWAS